MDKHELKENLIHIGLVTSVALILHNIIEGMAIYSSVLSDKSLGLAMTIGIGFHNIPLGMVIAGAFYQSNENIIISNIDCNQNAINVVPKYCKIDLKINTNTKEAE